MLAQVERRLADDALLIRLHDDAVRFIPFDSGIFILDALVSDAPTQAKVQTLMDSGVQWINSAEWTRLVETFEPPADFAELVRPLAAEFKRSTEENVAAHEQFVSSARFRSPWVKYGVTVAAMVLAVVALGNLLNHRPGSEVRWRDVDSSGDGVPLAVRNVVLVILLGLFDLACTVIAQRAGGFFEMNPLGHHLAESPFILVSFKITSLLVACGILLMLRRYRGAQIASWWLCLVCTVLTFRWVTYNSMFLT